MVYPARSLEKYLPLFDKQREKVVLDYGSGNLRNSIYLYRKGYEVFAVDLPNSQKNESIPGLTCISPQELQALKLCAGIVLLTFVLNLTAVSERGSIFDTITNNMTRSGYLLIETKGFSLFELDLLTIPRGFVRLNNHNGRYTLIVLYQYLGL